MTLLTIGVALFALGFVGALVISGIVIYKVHVKGGEPEAPEEPAGKTGWPALRAHRAGVAQMREHRRTTAKYMIAMLPCAGLCAVGAACVVIWAVQQFAG